MIQPINRELKPVDKARNRLSIRQGESFPFAFNLNGSESSFSNTAKVMQYPGDTPAYTPTVTYTDNQFQGILTGAETATLAIGQWFVYIESSDTDEDLAEPIKFYVGKGWT